MDLSTDHILYHFSGTAALRLRTSIKRGVSHAGHGSGVEQYKHSYGKHRQVYEYMEFVRQVELRGVRFKQGLGHSQFMERKAGPELLECDRKIGCL